MYVGRFTYFSKDIQDHFKSEKEEKKWNDSNICHRISFSLFAKLICESLNECDRKWRAFKEDALLMPVFNEMIALWCGLICSVELIECGPAVQAYRQYTVIHVQDDDLEGKNQLNTTYINNTIEALGSRGRSDISGCLNRMKKIMECMVENAHGKHLITQDSVVKLLYYTTFAEIASRIIDCLNNSKNNLKLGDQKLNQSIGASYDCDNIYKVVEFDDRTCGFTINGQADTIAITNLMTVAWRNNYNLSIGLFFYTAQIEDDEFIYTSSVRSPVDPEISEKCDYPILCRDYTDPDSYFLVSEP